jgi:hypothetical protein
MAPVLLLSSLALTVLYMPDFIGCYAVVINKHLQLDQDGYVAWWAWEDLNLRPHPYQGCALTN